jgi:hypothetical protein
MKPTLFAGIIKQLLHVLKLNWEKTLCIPSLEIEV